MKWSYTSNSIAFISEIIYGQYSMVAYIYQVQLNNKFEWDNIDILTIVKMLPIIFHWHSDILESNL